MRAQLAADGTRAVEIHGDRSQGQREAALRQFREGQNPSTSNPCPPPLPLTLPLTLPLPLPLPLSLPLNLPRTLTPPYP